MIIIHIKLDITRHIYLLRLHLKGCGELIFSNNGFFYQMLQQASVNPMVLNFKFTNLQIVCNISRPNIDNYFEEAAILVISTITKNTIEAN